MMRLALSNIASYALQVTVLVTAGAALARAFRIDEPSAMLAYWRILLAACLALPLCQPWNTVVPPALAPAPIVEAGTAVVAAGDVVTPAAPSRARPIGDLVLIALAAGVAARALWLTIGAFGLRRLRRRAAPLDPIPSSVRFAQERTGARAGMYVSDLVSGPITFGVLRPAVVFPPSVSSMPEHVQEAIACHELIHVRRRDWLHEILEEAVRAALWFHPAVWWLIGRIRLAREQVVDQAVIQLTQSREGYVESLLAVALAGSPRAFAPASSFLRRQLLKQRVARILQESTMTTRRLIASLTASAGVLAVAATLAVRSFPLQAQGTAPADTGEPVQIVSGGEYLVHGNQPHYSRRAIEQKVQGDVVVEMTLDQNGEVSDARVVSGPDELRKAALEAVLTWHYAPKAINSTVTFATLRFRLPPAGFEKAPAEMELVSEKPSLQGWAIEPSHERKHAWTALEKPKEGYGFTYGPDYELKAKLLEAGEPHDAEITLNKIRGDHLALHGDVEVVGPDHVITGKTVTVRRLDAVIEAKKPAFVSPVPLVRVSAEGVSEAVASEVLAQAGVAIGAAISEDTAKRIQQVARKLDEHLLVRFHKEDEGVVLMILTR